MSRFSNFLEVALGYTAVAVAHVQALARSFIPTKQAPTVVERLTPKKPIEVVEPELLSPEETAAVDHQFKDLHDRQYQEFERQFGKLVSKMTGIYN